MNGPGIEEMQELVELCIESCDNIDDATEALAMELLIRGYVDRQPKVRLEIDGDQIRVTVSDGSS